MQLRLLQRRPGGRRIEEAARELERLLAIGAGAEEERERDELAGLQLEDPSQRDDGIEHAAGRAGEPPAAVHRERLGEAPAAADPAHAVRLVLQRTRAGERVDQDREAFARVARSAPRHQGGGRGHPLGLDEQLGERRMGRPRGGLVEEHFGVGGDLQGARPPGSVPHRDPGDLGGGIGGDARLEPALDPALAARDLETPGMPGDLVGIGFSPDGLAPQRPERPIDSITEIDQTALRVLDRIGAPRGERDRPEPAASRAGRGEPAHEPAVREHRCALEHEDRGLAGDRRRPGSVARGARARGRPALDDSPLPRAQRTSTHLPTHRLPPLPRLTR